MTHRTNRRTGPADSQFSPLSADLLARAGSVAAQGKLKQSGSIPAAPQWIRLDALLRMVPMSASTVWRLSRAPGGGSFPRPLKLSSRITCWDKNSVLAWIAERAREAK